MRRPLAQCGLAVLLVIAVGGQWAILQTAAWLSMAVRYSRDNPLPVALERTFGGQHPCQLCLVVKEGREAEKSTNLQIEKTKLDLICYRTAASLPVEVRPSEISAHPFLLDPRFDPPPTPPPIAI